MSRHLFHLPPRIREREVPCIGPERQQVVVVRAARLAGLTGRAGHAGEVPIAPIEYVPARGAVHLFEPLVVPCIVGSRGVAAVLQQAGEAIPLERFFAEQFGRLSTADAPPQIELKQPILRGDDSLGEEQIMLMLGVDAADSWEWAPD